MNNINDIVANENPRDVILFVVRNKSISYPMIDMLYSRNDWVNIGNNLELLKLVHNMKLEGLIDNSDGGIRKGPVWKEPAFMTENKYTFE